MMQKCAKFACADTLMYSKNETTHFVVPNPLSILCVRFFVVV